MVDVVHLQRGRTTPYSTLVDHHAEEDNWENPPNCFSWLRDNNSALAYYSFEQAEWNPLSCVGVSSESIDRSGFAA